MAVLGPRFCARAFSSCSKWGPLFIAVRGPLTIAASRCPAQAPDAQAQQLWLTGRVALRHVGSSQTRARTRVPCIGRQTLNHCATREAPVNWSFDQFDLSEEQFLVSLIFCVFLFSISFILCLLFVFHIVHTFVYFSIQLLPAFVLDIF